MRRTNLEKLTSLGRGPKGRPQMQELRGVDDLIKLMADDRLYMEDKQVLPTQRAFILSDARYKAYMGPAGSGKTTTGVIDVILKALLLPGTKWFIARKNYNDLMDTTLRAATNVIGRLPDGTLIDRSKAAPQKWWLRPMSKLGSNFESPSEITFMGLTDNVGSYEFNGGFIDEADEVDEQYFQQLKGRLRYKPWPEYPDENYQIGLAFNPPSMGHWLHRECTGCDEMGEKIQEPTITLFRPEPRENQRNLPAGYYESMTASLPEDLRQRLVEGVWGSTFPGQPVIRQFKRSVHVRPTKYRPGATLFRPMDFGYNHPACLWLNMSRRGHIEVHREFKGDKLTGEAFASEVLRQTAEHFPQAEKFEDVGDPAVAQVKDTGQMLAILNRAGIMLRYTRTPFDLSLNLLRKKFETLIEGEPAIVIDPSCRLLIDGLAGGYHFKEDGITPHKGLYDHLIDALRYFVWFYQGSTITSTHGLPTSLAYWSKS